MSKFKWFWFTFSAWCLIAAVGAWALIYSPIHLESKKIGEFKAQINGIAVESQILSSPTALDLSRDELIKQWHDQGWEPISGELNLASVLLEVPMKYREALGSLVQIRMFQNNDQYRLLGLWHNSDDDQTYQWITDVPKNALEALDPSRIPFPLRPPANASNSMLVTTEKMEALMWFLPASPDPEGKLMGLCASQGFTGRLWSRHSNETVFFLQKASLRLLALTERNSGGDIFLLAKIN